MSIKATKAGSNKRKIVSFCCCCRFRRHHVILCIVFILFLFQMVCNLLHINDYHLNVNQLFDLGHRHRLLSSDSNSLKEIQIDNLDINDKFSLSTTNFAKSFKISMKETIKNNTNVQRSEYFSKIKSNYDFNVTRNVTNSNKLQSKISNSTRARGKKEWGRYHFNPSNGLKKKPIPLKIGLPVFIPSLPKSGTTSIWQYFNCGGHLGSHQYVKINDTYSELSADCIRRNIKNNNPTFDNCGNYSVYVDTGLALYIPTVIGATKRYARIDTDKQTTNYNIDCYYPSIQALESIFQHYSNSTIILVKRNSVSWLHSMKNWGNGSLLKRWMNCNISNFPTKAHSSDHDFIQFYEWHNYNVYQFAKNHPSLTFIEVSLEGNDTGTILQNTVGIPKTCWGKCTPTSSFCDRVPTSKR